MSFPKAATTGCSARVTTPGSQKCSTPTGGRLQSCGRNRGCMWDDRYKSVRLDVYGMILWKGASGYVVPLT